MAKGGKEWNFPQSHCVTFLFLFQLWKQNKKATQCDCTLTVCQRAITLRCVFIFVPYWKKDKKQRNDEVGVRQ